MLPDDQRDGDRAQDDRRQDEPGCRVIQDTVEPLEDDVIDRGDWIRAETQGEAGPCTSWG